MMDYLEELTKEEVSEQLVIAMETKELFENKLRELNLVILVLNYYLRTGVVLEPWAIGLNIEEE
jgi:hypothetical protein